MDQGEFVFTDQAMPKKYDELLVPVLFRPWAEALVARLDPGIRARALDVATGPGTVARVLAHRIGPEGLVAGSDSSPAMIAQAESHGAVAGDAPIAYTVAPAAPLPYPDHSFDLVTCQQGLQFFPDGGGALAEMARVLVPGGRLAASVWCPPEECSVFFAYQQSLREGGQPDLATLMETPFPRWTESDLADRARERGFRAVSVTVETRDLVFPGGVAEALAAFAGSPIAPMLARLDPAATRAIAEAAERTFAPLTTGAEVRGPMRSWILLAST